MAYLLHKEKRELGKYEFIELKVFAVPQSEVFAEGIKYSLSFVKNGICILRYDNEKTKGHHRHLMGEESKIQFDGIRNLMDNFLAEVRHLRRDCFETAGSDGQN